MAMCKSELLVLDFWDGERYGFLTKSTKKNAAVGILQLSLSYCYWLQVTSCTV